jgi:hypothetical protein
MMTVKPVDLHKCITDSSIWRVDTGSSALVGSSRSRTCPQLVKFVLKNSLSRVYPGVSFFIQLKNFGNVSAQYRTFWPLL